MKVEFLKSFFLNNRFDLPFVWSERSAVVIIKNKSNWWWSARFLSKPEVARSSNFLNMLRWCDTSVAVKSHEKQIFYFLNKKKQKLKKAGKKINTKNNILHQIQTPSVIYRWQVLKDVATKSINNTHGLGKMVSLQIEIT